MRPLRIHLFAVLLAACAGPDAGQQAESAAEDAVETEAPAPPSAAPEPAKLPPGRSSAPPAPEPAPTEADSAEAARQDVSPEWIQRSRSMESYANCMQKAAGLEEPVRARLQEACGRLPDAPK